MNEFGPTMDEAAEERGRRQGIEQGAQRATQAAIINVMKALGCSKARAEELVCGSNGVSKLNLNGDES